MLWRERTYNLFATRHNVYGLAQRYCHGPYSNTGQVAGVPCYQLQSQQTRNFKAKSRNEARVLDDAGHSVQSTDNTPPIPFDRGFKGLNVRDHLKKWSLDYKAQLDTSGVTEFNRHGTLVVPNSLSAKENTTTSEEEEEEDQGSSSSSSSLDAADGLDDIDTDRPVAPLNPGDLLLINGRFAVFLRDLGFSAQYLTDDGRWLSTPERVWFSYTTKSFASESDIAPIVALLPNQPLIDVHSGNVIKATGDVPYDVSKLLLNKMSSFNEELDSARREHATTSGRIFQALSQDTTFTSWYLPRAIDLALGRSWDTLSEAVKFVLVEKLASDDRMTLVRRHVTFILTIISKEFDSAKGTVRQWTREYQDAAAKAASGRDVSTSLRMNPLTKFITKARRLITKSRKIRAPTPDGVLGPTLEDALPASGRVERRPTGEIFDDDERKIITFLYLAYVLEPFARSSGNQVNRACASLILRAVGAYPEYDLGSSAGQLILQEMGCLDPWYISWDHSSELNNDLNELNHAAVQLKTKQDETLADLMFKPGTEAAGLPYTDSMESLRKDWGATEVFCVDKASTRVVDDGISVQPCPGREDATWVHVHIAHPSAFLPKDSAFVERSEFMLSTFYDHRSPNHMLPYEFTDRIGLQPNAPVFTVSTLLSDDGTVLDKDVSVGVIRNVIKLTSSELSDFLPPPEGPLNSLQVPGRPSGVESQNSSSFENLTTPLAANHQQIFKKLADLLLQRAEARNRERPDYLRMLRLPRSAVKALPSGLPETPIRGWRRIFTSEFCYGDPSIALASRDQDFNKRFNVPQDQKNIVENCMRLAYETCGAWTAERNIPVIYKGQFTHPGFGVDKLNNLGPHEECLLPSTLESTVYSANLLYNVQHNLLVSSPLRRFRDLQTQYQIDAHLKAQAVSKQDNPVTGSEIQYPWSVDELQMSMAAKINSDGRLVENKLHTHWSLLALYRAFHFDEAPLPKVWDMYVFNRVKIVSKRGQRVTGLLMPLGLRVVLQKSEAGWEENAKFRQFLPCKIVKIVPRLYLIECEAVGPATDSPSAQNMISPELRESDGAAPSSPTTAPLKQYVNGGSNA